ncbi:chemotaxis protein CheW [Methylobacillus sp. MM3]|jgi:purine-binding chemotaxis protein CheW|uniref:chemotaxis protein CheW n=1 Tax=Methylobacillus sp. MM3 TaxID=1848039 RepID=UPI000A7EAA79|nr:chemotaxis protein CheW [Methylobacillus sp. MM3]
MKPVMPPEKPKRARPGKPAAKSMATDAGNAILLERARLLAQPTEEAAAAPAIEVVALVLAYETYAIETAYVREVYPLKDLTPLPCTPDFVAGIVNVRGQVMSVIDLKQLFELPAKGLTDLNKIVILSDGTMEFGILADSILGVRNIPLHEIESGLPTLSGVRQDYLKGITAEGVVVLDAAQLLHNENIVVHEEVT